MKFVSAEKCYNPCIANVKPGDVYCYGGKQFQCVTGAASAWCNITAYNPSFIYWS